MSDEVESVFGEWKARQAAPGRVLLTDDRRALIGRRLQLASAADLVLLVEYAYEADTAEARFWRGEGSDGRQYLGLDNLLRVSKLEDRLDRARAWKEGGGGEPEPDDPEDGVVLSAIGLLRRGGA